MVFHLTIFYGEPMVSNRYLGWEVLKRLGTDRRLAKSGGDPTDWLWYYVHVCSEEKLRTLLIFLWVCWKNRNRVWHEQKSWDCREAEIIGRSMLNRVSFYFCPNPLLNSPLDESWSPPYVGTIKINSDGHG
ncbi:hypothetical protein QQ045_029020 [Rhodiola kirilowii]